MNASMHQTVVRSERLCSKLDERECKSKMATSAASLGEGVAMILKISMSREIETWEQRKFDLEMKELEYDGDTQHWQRALIRKRIAELDEKIKDKKRQCRGLDESSA